ncbi:MAG TPA: hypothetical protein VL614_03085 [Acetobacteraceae bacterium]|jgi:hypothetical protein|nr:hypothetical protein [Acetobacteraceae bacterium]
MTGRDPFVLTAIRNVEGRHSPYEWWALPPRQRTEAIYAELRRLDAETLARNFEGSRLAARRLAYAAA